MTHQAQSQSGRPLSKYARKVRAREEGRQAPFKFVEGETPTPPITQTIPPQTVKRVRTPPPPKAVATNRRVVFATVRAIAAPKGCLFLLTEDDEDVFSGLSPLLRFFRNHNIPGKPRRNDVFECEVGDDPNGRGLRVSRYISMLPRE